MLPHTESTPAGEATLPTVDASRLKEGLPRPQGATWGGEGTNFSVFSAHATKVEICLFDGTGKHETDRIELPEYTNQIFHGYLPTVGRGLITVTVCTVPMSQKPVIALIPTSSCLIPTLALTRASSSGVKPRRAWDHTILYETHVKGFTCLHPSVPERIRGTYAGLGTKEVIDYVKALSVTSVELLPIHTFANDVTCSRRA
jgi:isoamylase